MNLNQLLINMMYQQPVIGEECELIIRDKINGISPSMVGRFGANEIKAVLFPIMPSIVQFLIRKRIFASMQEMAGFFPANKQTIQKFSDLMIEDMKQLDVLGSWRIEETLLLKNFPNSKRVTLNSLEPYLSDSPWSGALEGLKILVIHPFSFTIERQYSEKRSLLFKDQRVLPKFKSLQTIKAVQTSAGQRSDFSDWFQALDFMKSEINYKDFDVAIIGCGAYGFPLAAHVKRLGKKAIHMGGATQILFGIKGKRWDNHPLISSLYNEHWVRPAPDDVPFGANKVEGGCYW